MLRNQSAEINSDETSLARVHHALIRSLIDSGGCPKNSELARHLGISTAQVEERLYKLSEIHGVVLHPHVCEPWVVHPFSVTPTLNWVEGANASWWAPCIWCACGVAVLAGGEVRIHTRFGAEAAPLVIRVVAGQAVDAQPVDVDDVWVHFAIPPSRAWQNVHLHCSMVLPFRSQEDVSDWCDRYKLPHGEAVPLHQVARLARLWYGTHADVNWHKWTTAEAQRLFHQAGLTSSFWKLTGLGVFGQGCL